MLKEQGAGLRYSPTSGDSWAAELVWGRVVEGLKSCWGIQEMQSAFPKFRFKGTRSVVEVLHALVGQLRGHGQHISSGMKAALISGEGDVDGYSFGGVVPVCEENDS